MANNLQLARQNNYEVIEFRNNNLFLQIGKKICREQGINNFNKYYMRVNQFKNDLDQSLLEYYCYLDIKYTEGINKQIKKMINLMDTFKIDIYDSFLVLDGDTESITKINEYFQEKKANIDDMDPQKNGRLCVSRLQEEWLRINFDIENYYEEIRAEINRPIKKVTQTLSIMDRFISAISSVSEVMDPKQQAITAQ